MSRLCLPPIHKAIGSTRSAGLSRRRKLTRPESAAAIKISDDLVAELRAADRVVIGTPMYNFAIPAVLKAYIDHIVRVGVTVSAANKGLLIGKSADVILASGGDFSPGSPVEKYNQASGYLRQVLAWIGITDVNIMLAGRALAGAQGETAVDRLGEVVAQAAVRELAATPRSLPRLYLAHPRKLETRHDL